MDRHGLVLSWLKLKVFQVVIKDTRAALLKIINQERQGEHIDQDLVKGGGSKVWEVLLSDHC